jgi:hypothetical protein
MFNGEEGIKISTGLSEDEFDEKAQEALESLGQVEITDRGVIFISPKTSMVSFLSQLTIDGKIKKTEDGYKVELRYSVSPSAACWVIAILLFCFLFMIGGAIIFGPLMFDKPNVARSVENALRDLKDSAGTRKRGRSSEGD